MLSLRDFWRRHRRKVFLTVGVLGSGYFLCKFYNGYRRRLDTLEREFTVQRENEELIKAQMQAHFENIQRISDTMTLPHAMYSLSCQIADDLDLSQLLDRLIKGKGQPNTLTPLEKLESWDRLKILSFTRMALSVWATTVLSLYIKVQVNILGRHLYIDTARKLGSPNSMESGDAFDREDQQKFLGNVDFLSQYGLPTLISDMEAATKEVLKGKQLRDFFNYTTLCETIMQILDTFMSMGSPHHWIKYMMPEDVKLHTSSSSSEGLLHSDMTEFDQLMVEARSVLSSSEFGNIIKISLKTVVENMGAKFREASLASDMPLAKVLPQVALMCPLLLEEPSKNQFIQVIKYIPEVELFFTLLYSNMPSA
ncbi:hypothetical protein L6164_008065 [Bauhinia variegata]|uniref:Uncharacterized protein n=1 Tax=Bauhinia variegata TaxID=167791 RepID=A0ACB9PGP7_BAUVA|nr:hypothetical protein L6164_008065 [Bauhinia variegata]